MLTQWLDRLRYPHEQPLTPAQARWVERVYATFEARQPTPLRGELTDAPEWCAYRLHALTASATRTHTERLAHARASLLDNPESTL